MHKKQRFLSFISGLTFILFASIGGSLLFCASPLIIHSEALALSLATAKMDVYSGLRKGALLSEEIKNKVLPSSIKNFPNLLSFSLIEPKFEPKILPIEGEVQARILSSDYGDVNNSLIQFRGDFYSNFSLFTINNYQKNKEDKFTYLLDKISEDRLEFIFKEYQNAVVFSRQGDFDSAIRSYSNALSRGSFAEAFLGRGRAHFERGKSFIVEDQSKSAAKEFFDAIEDYSRADKARVYSTRKLSEDFPDARARYIDPLLARGAAYIILGKFESAIADFAEAIKRNPDSCEAYLARANIYINQRKYQEAEKDLKEALERYPRYPAALVLLGFINNEYQEYQKASSLFSRVLDSQEDGADQYLASAYYGRGQSRLALNKYQAARNDFDQAVQQSPNQAEAYLELGRSLLLINENADAVVKFNQAIKLRPNYYEAYHLRGIAFAKLEEYENAESDLTKVIEKNPDSTEARYNRGYAYLNLYRSQSALEDFTKVIEKNPDSAEAFFGRGKAYYQLGDYDNAIQDFQQVISLTPGYSATSIDAYFWRGKSHYALRKYSEGYNDFAHINSYYVGEIDGFIKSKVFPLKYTKELASTNSGAIFSVAISPDY